MKTKVIIKWYGPYNINTIHNQDKATNRGVYAIYKIYGGKETLIYIGKTTRNFLLRINEHKKDWLWNIRGQLKIRFGILEYPNGTRYSANKLSDVESLLILWHTPSENTTSTLLYGGRSELEIINIGRRGSLCKTVSTKDLIWA